MAWPRVRLDEIARIVMGQSPPGATYNSEGDGLPFFQGKADFGDRYPTTRKWCSVPERTAEPEDILLSVRAPVGPTNLARENCCIGRGLAAIRANPVCVDQDYLRLFFKYQEPFLSQQGQGSTFAAIKRNEVAGLRVPLPPLAEQRCIVKVVSQADRLRRLSVKADATAQRILPALFIRRFGDPGRNPNRLPSVELGSVLFEGPQNGLYKPGSSYGEGTQILRIDGFYGGRITGLDALKRIRASSGEIEKYGLQESDIVVNRVNSEEYLGKSAIIPALSEPLLFESNMMRLAVDKSQVLPEFVLAHLQTSFTRAEILSKSKRAINQASINQQDVKSLKILRPSLEGQKWFVAASNQFQELSGRYAERWTMLEGLCESLLQRSFSDELTASWRDSRTALTFRSVELAGDNN